MMNIELIEERFMAQIYEPIIPNEYVIDNCKNGMT